MLFNSVAFILFFIGITILYYLIVPAKFQYILLVIASYFFYMCWNAKYALLIAVSTVITYLSGLGIEYFTDKYKENPQKQKIFKKFIVFCSFVSNLGILAFFKYGGFILDNINLIAHRDLQISFDIILPVGISFYIFQALGYTIDVYRGEIKAEKNIVYYALFVSFFPQLVAGPIERSGRLLKQIREKHYFDVKEFLCGFWIMLLGFFEKIVIADRAAIYVDKIFSDYTAVGGIQVLFAILGFSLQIYCDFSGYSHIAIGSARILGIRLMENFEQPYFALSIKDFWRRWHISLSSWFRDYLYIPLGGNQCGTVRKYFNLLITFLASGLWHGASWHFVIWGGIHACYQIAGDLLQPLRKKLLLILHVDTAAASHRMLRCFTTFCFVTLAWLFFRAESVKQALGILKYIWTDWRYVRGAEVGLNTANIILLLVSVAGLFVISCFHEKKIQLSDKLLIQNTWFKVLATFVITFIILLFGIWGGSYEASSFIYFQF